MNTLKNIFLGKIWANLGYCRYCIRQSFVWAAMSWAAAAVAHFLFPLRMELFVAVFATALTALWLAHIVTFGLRSMTVRDEDMQHTTAITRRNSLLIFGKFISAAALISAMPKVALAHDGDGSPDCGARPPCHNGDCPDDNGNCPPQAKRSKKK